MTPSGFLTFPTFLTQALCFRHLVGSAVSSLPRAPSAADRPGQ